jgi:hypothetical protein
VLREPVGVESAREDGNRGQSGEGRWVFLQSSGEEEGLQTVKAGCADVGRPEDTAW